MEPYFEEITLSCQDNERLSFFTNGNYFIKILKCGDTYDIYYDSKDINKREYANRQIIKLTITVDYVHGLVNWASDDAETQIRNILINELNKYNDSPTHFYDDTEQKYVITYTTVYVSRDKTTIEHKYERLFHDPKKWKCTKSAKTILE